MLHLVCSPSSSISGNELGEKWPGNTGDLAGVKARKRPEKAASLGPSGSWCCPWCWARGALGFSSTVAPYWLLVTEARARTENKSCFIKYDKTRNLWNTDYSINPLRRDLALVLCVIQQTAQVTARCDSGKINDITITIKSQCIPPPSSYPSMIRHRIDYGLDVALGALYSVILDSFPFMMSAGNSGWRGAMRENIHRGAPTEHIVRLLPIFKSSFLLFSSLQVSAGAQAP